MGSIKEMWSEIQEEKRNQRLAERLGISYEELCELEWTIDSNSSNDGMIYGYRIEFSYDSPREILNKIKGLEDGCKVYLGLWEPYNYYEEEFDAITYDNEYVARYREEMNNIASLLKLEVKDYNVKQILNRQVFIGLISTMETFLSDTFINLTFSNETYFKNFVKTHPDFKQRKFELSTIFEETDKLKETAKKVMLDTIYHNLPAVSKMYADTFCIRFPNIKEAYRHVMTRHDLVHRNGKSKDGNNVEIDGHIIQNLIDDLNMLIENIVEALRL